MEDPPVQGSRVIASTKHGSLSVDELAAIQPGMARLMDELSRRYWTLYYAAKAGNWDLARYMERESEKLLETIALVRPTYRADLKTFAAEHLAAIVAAIDAKDWPAFEKAYRRAVDASDMYHDKYNKRFIRFRLPDRPPDWFDLTPR